MTTFEVLAEVAAERARQDAKWGEQNHPNGTGGEPDIQRSEERIATLRDVRQQLATDAKKSCDLAAQEGRVTFRHILKEEVAEAIAEDEAEKLRKELIQVAAVAVQWVEAIDRRAGRR